MSLLERIGEKAKSLSKTADYKTQGRALTRELSSTTKVRHSLYRPSTEDITKTTSPTRPIKEDRKFCDQKCPLKSFQAGEAYTNALPAPVGVLYDPSDPAPPFPYTTLKPWQTRLLKIIRPQDQSLPKFQLVVVDFIDADGVGCSDTDEIVQYTALSYVWGDSPHKWEIKCNGNQLLVSDSLALALGSVSRNDPITYLWCDGICINQANAQEKAVQVRNMLRIFEKAQSVIAWLGQVDADAVSILRGIGSVLQLDPSKSQTVVHSAICFAQVRQIAFALGQLLESDYFNRTWIRQEIFAATNVIIRAPSLSMSFKDFDAKLRELLDLAKFGFHESRSMSNKESAFVKALDFREAESLLAKLETQYLLAKSYIGHSGTDVHGYTPPNTRTRYSVHWLKVLQEGTSFGASDPRDRVYGALGVITSPATRLSVEDRPDIDSKSFPISYEKTMSQVYQDVVKYLINTDRNLDVLTIFESRQWLADDLPSWVPDWRDPRPRVFLDIPPVTEDDNKNSTRATMQDISEYGRLSLKGEHIGSFSSLRLVADTAVHTQEKLPSANSEFGKHLFGSKSFESSLACKAYAIGEWWSNKRCGSAIVPKATQLSDEIVLLDGGSLPFVLRRLQSGTYRLIGAAIMCSGQADWNLFFKTPSMGTGDRLRLFTIV